MTLKSFVSKLSEDELIQVLSDYDEYEETGATGNTLLRALTTEYMESVDLSAHKTLWMDRLTFECAVALVKYYAKNKISSK